MTTAINWAERKIFYFLIFALPFQTRLILKEWFVGGSPGKGGGAEFNEWNSAFLYFTDLLVLAILFLWALRLIFKRADGQRPAINERKNCSLFIVLCPFFIISGLSLFGAQNKELGIYYLIKLAEFILLFLCIGSNFKKMFRLEFICLILMASAFLQAALGIFQFSLQRDLNLKILGESPLGPDIDGVAKIAVFGANHAAAGVKMIRAYGTFPHPNILAAFLVFSIFCFYFFYFKREEAPSFKFNMIFFPIFVFLVFGLLLTFSRTIIVLFFVFSAVLFLFFFFKKTFYRDFRQKTAALCIFLILAVLLCVVPMSSELYSRFVASAVDPSVNLRYFYNFIGLEMLKENPFFGRGLGNFVWRLDDFQGSLRAANLIYKIDVPETEVIPRQAPAWLYQPVHNVYLLIASETGILGLLAFLVFLGLLICPFAKIIKENNLLFIVYCLLFIVAAAATTDHFFWTLQQGRLMFWILAGILAAHHNKT